MNKKYKIPVILYETDEQNIPYIEVEKNDEMPPVLFIQEYKHTGEFEPDDEGKENPIVDITIHMYANMNVLSKSLTPEKYDEVRVAMGLKPLNEAKAEGQKILNKVYDNVNQNFIDKVSEKNNFVKEINEKLTEKFYKSQEENNINNNNKVKLQYEIVDDEDESEINK